MTGPLLDGCGNVVGFSVANDVQTLATSPGTRYRWRGTLLRVLEDLALNDEDEALLATLRTSPRFQAYRARRRAQFFEE